MDPNPKIILAHVHPEGVDSFADFLGLFYLAAVLEQRGYDPWVFHGAAGDFPAVLAREAAGGRVGAVGLACDFDNQAAVERLSRFVKTTLGCPVIVGGPQAVALGADFLARSNGDAVLRGEAEETLPAFLDLLLRGIGGPEAIAGLTWRDPAGNLRENPEEPPGPDLDHLPVPAYHRSLHRDRRYGMTLFTGRGCPFSCAFCQQSRHRRQVRRRSLTAVFAEIETNLQANPDLTYLTILDDTFTLDAARVADFCTRMTEVRRTRELAWYCEGHVRHLARHPELLPLMVQAGLVRLQIGVESGCQAVLDRYRKNVTLAEIEQVVAAAVAAGVPQIATNLIIGGPGETDETIAETEAFAARLLARAPGVLDIMTGFLRPYPGTAIAQDPAAFGLRVVDAHGERSTNDWPLVIPAHSSEEEVAGFRLRVQRHIQATMKDLLTRDQVPFAAILSQYRLAQTFCITSAWYTSVLRPDPFLDEYFRLVLKGEGCRLADVPAADRPAWHPQRTMEVRRFIDLTDDMPRLGGVVLSPLEFEVLLHASGKLSFAEVEDSLFRQFGPRFSDRGEFAAALQEIFVTFDRKHWMTCARW
jgi:anaerobic magnesium-protoporphyrin IX monomethyl ester cyclase